MPQPGPKPTVTPTKKKKILRHLRIGMSLRESLQALGISYAAYRRARDADADFGRGVKSAPMLGKAHHLERIDRGEGNWQSSAWFLERKYGQEYGKKLDIEGNLIVNLVEEIVNAPQATGPQTNGHANGTAAPGAGRL